MDADSRICPSSRVEAAAWLAPRLRGFGEWVESVVPAGFEAYARIFHPASGPSDKRARWAEVARWSGRVMHPHADFELLERPLTGRGVGPIPGDEPQVGDLEPDLVVSLSRLLSQHTQTRAHCWFLLWDGWGWITGSRSPGIRIDAGPAERAQALSEWHAMQTPPFPREVIEGPRVHLPGRDYLLLEGPLDAVSEIGSWTHWPNGSFFDPQSPNLWWPDDRAWCVATEIDFNSTYVGGTASLVEELLSAHELEAMEVLPTDPLIDSINASSG